MGEPAEPPSRPSLSTDPVVEVRDLVASYDEQCVLNGIDLTLQRGEILIILGGSGSGKSTLLKCILGIHSPDSGTVRVLGRDIWALSDFDREEIYKNIGIVYQGGALFGSLTVADNVALPLREHTRLAPNIINITTRMKLGLVGLGGFEHRMPSQLSGGQAKRVAFARSIAMDPKILFCDEPSAGLDPRVSRGIDDLILNLNQAFNMAIFVVTHEMESVKVIADRILMLIPRAGGAKVAFRGTYDEMTRSGDPDVQEFVQRRPLQGPHAEAREILRELVGED